MPKVFWEGKLIESDELEKILETQVDRGVGKYGLDGWLRSFFINLKPLPEPHSLRQIFYKTLPRIVTELPDFVKDHPDDWGDNVYNRMSSILSELVLDHKCSYQQLNIMDDSGASSYIYQDFKYVSLPPPEKCSVKYPIEVWVEKNAVYNSLEPLFCWNREKGCATYQINLISGKGFAKTQSIEKVYLNRTNDVKVILYFGDFDPSGVEMPNDIQRRFKWIGLKDIEVIRIGIFPNQIPDDRKLTTLVHIKESDTRAKAFQEKYGDTAYESEALTPSEMRELVSKAIDQTIKEFDLEEAKP